MTEQPSVYHYEAASYADHYTEEHFPNTKQPYKEGSEEYQLWQWAYSRRLNELLGIKIRHTV